MLSLDKKSVYIKFKCLRCGKTWDGDFPWPLTLQDVEIVDASFCADCCKPDESTRDIVWAAKDAEGKFLRNVY
jgi:ribosomal protein L37E